MPYNTYMPYYGYTNYYQNQPTTVTPNQNQQPTNDIIWVQGEAGAKAYLVAPNNTVTLWDSESPTIYLKTSDARGIPSMKILDFKERATNAQNAPNFNFNATGDKDTLSDDIKALNDKYEAIEARLAKLEKRKEGAENEPLV